MIYARHITVRHQVYNKEKFSNTIIAFFYMNKQNRLQRNSSSGNSRSTVLVNKGSSN